MRQHQFVQYHEEEAMNPYVASCNGFSRKAVKFCMYSVGCTAFSKMQHFPLTHNCSSQHDWLHILVFKPVVSQLSHVKQNLITPLVSDAACHNPRWSTLEEFPDQVLKLLNIFFWPFASILPLFAFVAFCEY